MLVLIILLSFNSQVFKDSVTIGAFMCAKNMSLWMESLKKLVLWSVSQMLVALLGETPLVHLVRLCTNITATCIIFSLVVMLCASRHIPSTDDKPTLVRSLTIRTGGTSLWTTLSLTLFHHCPRNFFLSLIIRLIALQTKSGEHVQLKKLQK